MASQRDVCRWFSYVAMLGYLLLTSEGDASVLPANDIEEPMITKELEDIQNGTSIHSTIRGSMIANVSLQLIWKELTLRIKNAHQDQKIERKLPVIGPEMVNSSSLADETPLVSKEKEIYNTSYKTNSGSLASSAYPSDTSADIGSSNELRDNTLNYSTSSHAPYVKIVDYQEQGKNVSVQLSSMTIGGIALIVSLIVIFGISFLFLHLPKRITRPAKDQSIDSASESLLDGYM